MDYRNFLQKIIYHVIDPFIRMLITIGITPNAVTAGGFAGNLVAMGFFINAALNMSEEEQAFHATNPYALIGWGGVVILAAGLFDMMDGRLARLSNMSSKFGALWDSTLDRYSELVTLFGICLVFIEANWFWTCVVTFMAMTGSIMVSYVRARAEGLNTECKVGLMQRPERVVVTAITAIISGATENLWWLAGGMILIAILANITAFWRIGHCYKKMKNEN